MSIDSDLRPATLTVASTDLLRPLSRLAALERVWNLLLPASAAPDLRLGLDLLGGGWLLLVSGKAAAIFSDRPFPAGFLRAAAVARGVTWTPRPREFLGAVAVAAALAFAGNEEFGAVLTAECSDSLNR